MHIPITDEYVITSDSCNFILNEKMVGQKGKKKGKEYLSAIGFYPTLIQALDAVLTKKMLKSTKRTLNGLIREHTALVGHLRGLLPKVKE